MTAGNESGSDVATRRPFSSVPQHSRATPFSILTKKDKREREKAYLQSIYSPKKTQHENKVLHQSPFVPVYTHTHTHTPAPHTFFTAAVNNFTLLLFLYKKKNEFKLKLLLRA
jgi:hypothetical protein